MNARALIAMVAAMSIAIVALGLRVGAGETVRAAIVMGAPLGRDGLGAWQLRTQEDDGHTRTAISTPFVARVTARGESRTIEGATNVDGVAEIPLDSKDLAEGDDVAFDVRDAAGAVLAQGHARWPDSKSAAGVAPKIADDVALRPTRSEGAVRMSVAAYGGALAPGEADRVWIHVQTSAVSANVDAAPDLGVEIASPYRASGDPTCAHDGFIELVARGLNGGVELHAKDGEERAGVWYGALPVVPGAMHVALRAISPEGPVHVAVTSAGARTIAYVEIDDDTGREAATVLALRGEPPRADATLDVRSPGKHFVVVSGEPTGAESMSGATRAFPIWIGPNAPCEMSLAKTAAYAFPRFVALDGFVDKHQALARRRKKGRLIAFIGLALGSLLETLLLLRAARDGKRELEHVQNAIIAEGEVARVVPSRQRSLLDVLVVLVLSLLGFALLFALVDYAAR